MIAEVAAAVLAATATTSATAGAPPPAISQGAAAPANAPGGAAIAQAVSAPASQSAGAAPVECCRVAAGTIVTIELAQPVSSRNQKGGERFALRLAAPLVVDGRTVIPAGVTGYGEVVDAASAGLAGRPAKLILAARSIDYNGARVPLRGFRLSGGGHDNSHVATVLSATPYVGLLALAIPGGEVVYPAGTRANAKVTSDVTFAAAPAAPPALPTPSARPLSAKSLTPPIQGSTP